MRKRLLLPWLLSLVALLLVLTLGTDLVQDARAEEPTVITIDATLEDLNQLKASACGGGMLWEHFLINVDPSCSMTYEAPIDEFNLHMVFDLDQGTFKGHFDGHAFHQGIHRIEGTFKAFKGTEMAGEVWPGEGAIWWEFEGSAPISLTYHGVIRCPDSRLLEHKESVTGVAEVTGRILGLQPLLQPEWDFRIDWGEASDKRFVAWCVECFLPTQFPFPGDLERPEPIEAPPAEPDETSMGEPEGAQPVSDRDGDEIPDDQDACPEEYAETASGCPEGPASDQETDFTRFLEDLFGGKLTTTDLADNLKEFLAGKGGKAPTSGQAAAAGGATAALLTTWMLNQLLSGASRGDVLRAVSQVLGRGKAPVPEVKPVPEAKKAPEKKARTALTKQQIKDAVAWGLKYNRKPEDIMEDLNSFDKQQGGSGNIVLDEPLFSVETRYGRATGTEREAHTYLRGMDRIDELANEWVRIQESLKRLEEEVKLWKETELDVIGRWMEGTWQLQTAYNRHQARLEVLDARFREIEAKSGRPSSEDYTPWKPGGREMQSREYEAWQKALREWEWTPEGQRWRSEFEKIDRERADSFRQYKRDLRELFGKDPETGLESPTSRYRSWFTKPAAKLEEIGKKQDQHIARLKEISKELEAIWERQKSLDERAQRGNPP